MGDTDRAPDISHCIGRTGSPININNASEGSLSPQRKMSPMEARQRGAKEQGHGSGFPGCSRDRDRYRETERQTERHTLSLACKSFMIT